MSALILKDLYIMKNYCRSVLLMVVIFWGASIFTDSGNLFWTFFPVIVGSVTPATLLSYDEKFRWNQYCDTMPISRAAVVAEKYVLTAATVLLLTAGSVAVQLMASGRTGEAPDDLEGAGAPPLPANGRDVFLYVISGFKQRNPAAAMALIDRLR